MDKQTKNAILFIIGLILIIIASFLSSGLIGGLFVTGIILVCVAVLAASVS